MVSFANARQSATSAGSRRDVVQDTGGAHGIVVGFEGGELVVVGTGPDGESDSGDRHQSLDRRIVQCALCNLAVDEVEILGKTVKLSDVPLDRRAFVLGDPRGD